MKPVFRKLVSFPFFRWLRFGALALIGAAAFAYALTGEEWRVRRNPFVFAYPLGYLCNALSAEIIFRRLRSKPPGQ